MARRIILAPALAALAAALLATSAFAHAGNPNYESLVDGVTPSIPGFSVVVLNGDDRLEVVNHSSTDDHDRRLQQGAVRPHGVRRHRRR